MKRLLSVFLAVCLSLTCMCGFVACDHIDTPSGVEKPNGDVAEIYYAYDPETDEYEDGNYITLKGNTATWHSVDVSLGDIEFTGSAHFVNNGFAITLNGEFSAVDSGVVTYKGEKESDGVLRVDNSVITKYSQLVPEPTISTDLTVRYFCKKGSKPEKPVLPIEPIEPEEKIDGTYYQYDSDLDTYSETDCIVVDGESCNIVLYLDGYEVILNGTCTYANGEFAIDCSGEIIGVILMRVVYKGDVEKSGVLHITYMELYIKGTDDIVTDTSDYFCKIGEKPDSPAPPPLRTITLSANGGAYADGTNTVLTANQYGCIVLPSNMPTRDGYFFNGYNTKKDGNGTAVDNTTVFFSDATIYAVGAKEVTVTFMVGITVANTKKVGDGMPLGDFDIPYDDEQELFKGWFKGKDQYVSFTNVHGDTTLKAEWYTYKEIEEYRHRLFVMRDPGSCVFIHYRRKDHLVNEYWEREADYDYKTPIKSEVYGDWPIWAWPDGSEGRFFHAAEIDMFGAVYVIDCTRTFYDCGWDGKNLVSLDKISKFSFNKINIQIVNYPSVFKGAFWASDGGNLWLDFEQMHVYDRVFITEGDTQNLRYYSSASY